MPQQLNSKHMLMILLPVLLLALGCSKTPVPSSYPYSTQKQMQAAEHWQILAKDIGNDISLLTGSENFISQPLSVTTYDNSPFSQAFRSLLTTELVNSGIRLTNSSGGYELYWSVQQVSHQTSRSHTKVPPGTYLGMSALGYGVYKLWTDSTQFAEFLAVGAGAEALRGLAYLDTKLPHNEIIININIQKEDELVYRFSNIYYINDLDTGHYFFSNDLYNVERNVQTKTINVISTD